ncbi:transcriptional regulator, MarR family with acetyltransferase activity [Bryocella elongata]|uniref:Transcriptional regulator, MarR family with acetyltransferase activity n=1 Tax=Bryocella elongata TaxID=863522 RepID=A0A1H6BK29_9BACT|nr:helix-turn-helix domain-containing GNAT family N-acetyltransferase [Bryocella elongata]SEG60982.1 transcriptional regulator, MarR family with acetyltransferase activity [Bryocella elongata]
MSEDSAHDSVLRTEITAFRGFNRFYTRFIGILGESLLETGFSLTEARILYELATRGTSNASEIAQTLGVDPAYLSRVLTRFETADLLRRTRSKQDARRAELSLTRRGKTLFRKLNSLSEAQALQTLEPLSLAERQRMIAAMGTIESLLLSRPKQDGAVAQDKAAPRFILRAPLPGDYGLVVSREGALYAQEYGFDASFEALVARIVADFVDHLQPARERCWIAEKDGRHAGHIFLVQHPKQKHTAKLRLLLVEPEARGCGVGAALVAACIAFAREAGYRKVTLWTQSILGAARQIYTRSGFTLVAEQDNFQFGKQLTSQTWELEL